MINGTLTEISNYLPEKIRDIILSYIDEINEKSPEEITYLMGDCVYGHVMSYHTLPKEECMIEAHDRYVDVQISIVGSEGIEVYQRQKLKEMTKYDVEKDVTFYQCDREEHFAVLNNIPGRFSMFFSEDAHCPKMKLEGAEGYVKKYVIKIDKNLFEKV